MKDMITFSEFIIKERSLNFYNNSLLQMYKCKSTIEDWFSDLYFDYCVLYNIKNDKTSKIK